MAVEEVKELEERGWVGGGGGASTGGEGEGEGEGTGDDRT